LSGKLGVFAGSEEKVSLFLLEHRFLSSLCLSEEDWSVSEVSSCVLVETCGENGRCVVQKDVIVRVFAFAIRVNFSVERRKREGVIPST
jgi:hypothetical protein